MAQYRQVVVYGRRRLNQWFLTWGLGSSAWYPRGHQMLSQGVPNANLVNEKFCSLLGPSIWQDDWTQTTTAKSL